MTLDSFIERTYVLDDNGLPKPAENRDEYIAFAGRGIEARRIGRDDVDGQDVSTVFLMHDHGWWGGPPVLFETMIFGGPHDQFCDRYTTRADAEAGHARVVAALRAGESPEQHDG